MDKKQRNIMAITTALSVGLLVGLILAGGGAWLLHRGGDEHADHATSQPTSQPMAMAGETSGEDEILYWTCGMHPSVRSDGPGKCPICFMDLTPVRASEQAGGSAEDILARLQVSAQGQVLAQIETVPVAFRRLEHEINTSGRLTLDERRVSHIHARIGGWIEEVFVEFTGEEVTPGQPLVSIYSEELVTAQQEYLLALQGRERLSETSYARARQGSEQIVEAARQRLRQWGITDAQIERLEETGEVQQELVLHMERLPSTPQGGVVMNRQAIEGMRVNRGDRLYTVADLSHLWMMADVYEYEMAWIAVGQEVEISSSAYPGRSFEGRIDFIEPTLDAMSRTVQVRVDVQNSDGELRPEMWVDARIRVPLDHSSAILQRMRQDAQRRWRERWGDTAAEDMGDIAPDPAAHIPADATHVCPMLCPDGYAYEADQHCPTCGMVMLPRADVLEESTPEPTTQSADAAPYLCPMQCEGGYAFEPGQHCPVCGMIMVPREEVVGEDEMAEEALTWEDAPEGTVLSIPDLAVIRTGERQVVYVEAEPGVYEGREVIVGPPGEVLIDGQRELHVPVLAGLDPGMRVVTRGNFLLDSQTTLTGGAAAAYGSALGSEGEPSAPPAHQH